ncbi:MAG: hypothetical protein CMJ78_22375 [Planctomycetaceae bacterium]|nr:hypothetical protein [Planctomycetaceae bacterium]
MMTKDHRILVATLSISIALAALFVDTASAEERIQPWEKKGRILAPGFAGNRSAHVLSAPCVIKLKSGRLRMYFWAVGQGGHSLFAAEASRNDPIQWKLINEKPLLVADTSNNIRSQGPSFPWVVPREDAPWLLYYCAWGTWAPPGELPNRTSLAISEDQGLTWKVTKEPLLPLGPPGSFDAGITGSVCVLRLASSDYRMWYTAGERYELIEGSKRGIVHLGYATSKDGVEWQRHPKPLLSPRLGKVEPFEAVVSKPSVLKLDGTYHMWFSVYKMKGKGYRLEYASSKDGVNWQRAFDKELMPLTPDGFDSVNQSYPNVIEVEDELWMFYVGNNFGSTGIGWATMKKSALK